MFLSLIMAIKQLDHDEVAGALGVLAAALSISRTLHSTCLLVCFYLLSHILYIFFSKDWIFKGNISLCLHST